MRIDTGLKVASLCAVTLVSNLVLASEARVAGQRTGKTQSHRSQRLSVRPAKTPEVKPAVAVESVAEKPLASEKSAINFPVPKEEAAPVDKYVPPLELKGVRG